MKRLLLSLSLAALALPLAAQNTPVPAKTMAAPTAKKPPLSPPEVATATIGNDAVTIVYSSPRLRGRDGHIFGPGGLISHDKHYPVWRAGANAATTFKTDTDVRIGRLLVPKGTYTLFVDISNPDQWTLVVSKDTGEWGLSYNSADDLGRVPMQMRAPKHTIQNLRWTIHPSPKNNGRGGIALAWEDHIAIVPIMAE